MELAFPRLLYRDTYLAMVQGALGTAMFQHLYQEVYGERKDILEDGTLPCMFFVSSVPFHFAVLESFHATVSDTERDMLAHGWYSVAEPKERDVLLWENAAQHEGQYLGILVFTWETIVRSVTTTGSYAG